MIIMKPRAHSVSEESQAQLLPSPHILSSPTGAGRDGMEWGLGKCFLLRKGGIDG